MKVITFLAQRRKFIVAEVTGAVGWSQLAWVPDGTIDRNEWYALAVVLLGGLGVHAVSNAPAVSAVSVVKEAFRSAFATGTPTVALVPVSPPPNEVANP